MRAHVFSTAFGILVLATLIMTATQTPALWLRYPPMLYPVPPVQGSQSSSMDSYRPSKMPYGKAPEQAKESHDLHAAPRAQRANKAPAEKTIWLYDDFFAPDVVLVSVGGTVLWENKGLHSH
ncbi:MAG TPA: hypothetical protein VGY58_13480, partial [Gemmataceae bacterium]|nr:hypothetical protein [Gemmataceae bacterium]